MVLTAEQHSRIAASYERAAADESLPTQQRAAFARKADWFRLLARIGAKKEEAVAASRRNDPPLQAASSKLTTTASGSSAA
jgi:hypothetical protein